MLEFPYIRVRRTDESLMALLECLDASIEDALEREVLVDEINP